jgi:hypothetical protein
MKKCKICENQFEQKTLRGSEQLYCSDKCRQQGYLQRKAMATIGENPGNMGLPNKDNIQARPFTIGEVDRANFASIGVNPIDQLEKTYQAKNEALRFELQLAAALKEIEELKTKNNVLSMQIETMDDDQPAEESGNFLAGVMKNPQPVIMAVNILIDKGFEIYERVQSKKQKIAQA